MDAKILWYRAVDIKASIRLGGRRGYSIFEVRDIPGPGAVMLSVGTLLHVETSTRVRTGLKAGGSWDEPIRAFG